KSDNFQNFIIVRYIVGMDGKLSNVSIVRGVNAEFDKEALRIISILPTLIPAKIKGKPVSSWDVVPIVLH
ncbi:MAG: energy transducer TonB, partial [Muribaculaceae bacterium]|nr:energy transducer TonB [Muribaculaceae bacterium]